MMYRNVLKISKRNEFRDWLLVNSEKEKECYLIVKRGKPIDDIHFWYIDAVEEALCFGWIDSTVRVIDGIQMQRFSPRRKNSNWTELNKERVRRLERLGIMTDVGRKLLPPMEIDNFVVDKNIENDLKNATVWNQFLKFHPLYQRVRLSNLMFYRNLSYESYNKMLNHVIEETKKGKMFGNWNDYGRLI